MSSTTKTRIACYAELSEPLDLLSGRSPGHALRACLLGFPIGRELGFSTAQLGDLLATILLKDLVPSDGPEHTGPGTILRLFERLQKAFGRMADAPMTAAESHTARLDVFTERLTLAPCVHRSLTTLRERWDGSGPLALEANTIPLIAAIALVAETAELAWSASGANAAKSVIRRGSGKIFSPDVASAFDRASRHPRYWAALETPDLAAAVVALEPPTVARHIDDSMQAAINGVVGELQLRGLGLSAAVTAAAPRSALSTRRTA